MDRRQELTQEHARLSHAMQSGVAFEHNRGSRDGEPKHLRVGINVALSDHSSLVRLLIAKGVISELEYLEAIVEGMRQEVERYEVRARAAMDGAPITFG